MSGILLRIAGAACLAAGTATAMTSPAGAAAGATALPGTARALAPTVLVSSLTDSGPGSLRAAIRFANRARAGRRAVIGFSVAGVITLRSPLPPIAARVIIDGRSAPGHVPGGPPVVEVDGNRHAGLLFAGGSRGSALLGLAVDNAAGAGITLAAGAVTLDGDYVGLSLSGRAFGNRGDGIYAGPGSDRDRIGLNPSRVSGAVANVISGNGGSGIVLAGSSGDTVAANRIGTSRAGNRAVPNRGNGIWITGGSRGNEIGGTAYTDTATGRTNNPTGSEGTVPPVFVVPPLGNLISGNRRNGVLISGGSRRNVLNGNFIGTTARGDAALGNHGNGVWIDRAGANSLIGCRFVNNPFVYYNVVSGNYRNGLRVTDSAKVVVQGDFFGIGAGNTAVVANRADGVRVDGSSAGTQVGGVIPLGNVAAGNGRNGIEVTGRARGFVTFNTFGGLLAFKGAAPNRNDGLLVTGHSRHTLVRTNVFSGNRRNGIEVAGDAARVAVDPDIAGLTTEGNAALPNGGDGLLIRGSAHDIAVGGSLRSVIPQNTFSGNDGHGVVITGWSYHTVVFGSFLGPEILGRTALGNKAGGILLSGHTHDDAIGLPGPRYSNLISGNTGNGVTLSQRACRNAVLNNFIGLNRFGRRLPNTGRALVNNGCHNVIRGNRYR